MLSFIVLIDGRPAGRERPFSVIGRCQLRGQTRIADAFEITERSARAHIQMIVEKLSVKNRVEAVAVGVGDGLIGV
jgi:Bacterial regulatory proteins, luxR family